MGDLPRTVICAVGCVYLLLHVAGVFGETVNNIRCRNMRTEESTDASPGHEPKRPEQCPPVAGDRLPSGPGTATEAA